MAWPREKAPSALQWLIWLAQALAVAVGLAYGYVFGARISGPLLGILLAAITATFGALGITWIVDLGLRLRGAADRSRPPPT